MEDRLSRIQGSIPKKFYFDESFEKNGFAPQILADVPLCYDKVDHGNILRCSPLLDKKQEHHLFRKLNYLRYRLVKLTNGIENSDQIPSPKPCRGQNLKLLKESGLKRLESLILQIQDTRNIILKANTRLIVKQAERYSQSESEYEEMVSNGYCHVITAIDNFDFRRGFKFSTYCVNVLKTNLWRDRTTGFKVRAPLEFSESIDLVPSRFESDHSEMNAAYNKKMVEIVFRHIRETMNKPEDKVEILRGYFGIGGGDPMILRELSDKVGVTKERVRQIKKQVLIELGRSGLVYDPVA